MRKEPNRCSYFNAYDHVGGKILKGIPVATHPMLYIYNSESALSSVSNTAWSIGYLFDGVLDSGYVITLANDEAITTLRSRDPHRRELTTGITNLVATALHSGTEYDYNELGNITTRNDDAFDYNARSEVTEALLGGNNSYKYEYDNIGNNCWTVLNFATNYYTANNLNQYISISAPLREPQYDLDGNLLSNGANTYTWDAENRLTSISINNLFAVQNIYDPQHHRVVKSTPNKTDTFLYDGWLLIGETIAHTSGAIEIREHVWGKDLYGSRDGAGGVGGLLATRIGNYWYFPLYDHNGNITDYINESGITVAHREYDAFGNTISGSGPMVDTFNFWYSTKYLDHETGHYYYGYRFYDPVLMRWLNPDPIEEQGGVNRYGFVGNDGVNRWDKLGMFWFCCGGKKYNPITHCCCGKTIQERKKTDTGVRVCKQYGRLLLDRFYVGSGILRHAWIEVDRVEWGIGFYPDGINFEDMYISLTEDTSSRYPVIGKRCESIKLSPCRHDFEVFRAHIFYYADNYSLPYHNYFNNCYFFVNNAILASLTSSLGCTQ